MRSIKCFILAVCIVIASVGCSRPTEFNAYKHMSRILTITTQDQFEHDKDTIMSHVSDSLKPQIQSSLTGTVYDDSYSITERRVYVDQSNNKTSIIIEYDCTSFEGDYLLVAYFSYVDDMLVAYSTHKIMKAVE